MFEHAANNNVLAEGAKKIADVPFLQLIILNLCTYFENKLETTSDIKVLLQSLLLTVIYLEFSMWVFYADKGNNGITL